MRLAMAIDEYLLFCRAENMTPNTLRWYEQKLRLFTQFVKADLGLTQVEGITPSMCSDSSSTSRRRHH